MKYAVEAWTFPSPDDEEPVEEEMVESAEFNSKAEAMAWAWERLEEGFYVRLWKR